MICVFPRHNDPPHTQAREVALEVDDARVDNGINPDP